MDDREPSAIRHALHMLPPLFAYALRAYLCLPLLLGVLLPTGLFLQKLLPDFRWNWFPFLSSHAKVLGLNLLAVQAIASGLVGRAPRLEGSLPRHPDRRGEQPRPALTFSGVLDQSFGWLEGSCLGLYAASCTLFLTWGVVLPLDCLLSGWTRITMDRLRSTAWIPLVPMAVAFALPLWFRSRMSTAFKVRDEAPSDGQAREAYRRLWDPFGRRVRSAGFWLLMFGLWVPGTMVALFLAIQGKGWYTVLFALASLGIAIGIWAGSRRVTRWLRLSRHVRTALASLGAGDAREFLGALRGMRSTYHPKHQEESEVQILLLRRIFLARWLPSETRRKARDFPVAYESPRRLDLPGGEVI